MQLTFPNGEHPPVAFDHGEIGIGSRPGQGVSLPGHSLAAHHCSLVSDRRGLLADLATGIADADGNIDAISMEKPDGAGVIAMFFGVQVRDRRHLAAVMRNLRRIPDVRRVQRART